MNNEMSRLAQAIVRRNALERALAAQDKTMSKHLSDTLRRPTKENTARYLQMHDERKELFKDYTAAQILVDTERAAAV